MGIVYETKRRAREAVAPFVCFILIVYFGYHAIQGDRGLLAYLHLTKSIAQLEQTYEEVSGDRKTFENAANRLRSDNLDTDLLEERSRAILGLVRKDESVVLKF